MYNKSFTTTVISREGAAIRLERINLTKEDKRALSLTREQLEAVSMVPKKTTSGKQ